MNYRFKNFISSANENKASFDSSIEGVRTPATEPPPMPRPPAGSGVLFPIRGF